VSRVTGHASGTSSTGSERTTLNGSRYIRQEILDLIGPDGQRRISAASVVLVGCGALGTNIANNLVRSGVGSLRIVDRDVVELDNLQRQVLFHEGHARERTPKAIAAVEQLREINSSVALDAQVCEVTAANVESLLAGFDLVMDGTDNVQTRSLINAVCLKTGTPWIVGGAVGSTGFVMPIIPGRTPCYRCLLAELPAPGTTPTAATAGILNSTTAVVGALQCSLALRLLVGALELGDQALLLDVWDLDFSGVRIPRRPDCPACGH